MKILIATNHSYMLYRFRKDLIFELMKEHEIILSMPFVGHEDDFKNNGITCIETPVDRRGINPFKDMKLMKIYQKLMSEHSPDMVITYSIKPNIYLGLICRAKKINCFANVQGLGTAFQKPLLKNFVTVLYRAAMKKNTKVFFENTENAEFFVKKHIVSKEKTKVLPGAGVDLCEYSYSAPKDDGVCTFLFVGRIMREKGTDEFFTAAQKLKELLKDKVAFELVGFYEDEYRDKVEELAKSGVIKFHGFKTDVLPFYQNADCVVLPSYHEGMSNVLLEGAAVGRVLITSDIPGCREAVEDKVGGYLCKVKDADMLYSKMLEFANLDFCKQVEMGKNGRMLVSEKFDKKKVVKETVNALFVRQDV